MDEYTTPRLLGGDLNMMCDGSYMYPIKGCDPLILPEVLVIVCGNAPIAKVYPNVHVYLESRFIEICVD
jgi:hypothetical protein